jgi:LysR family transcriptional activator of nhaA
VTYGFRLTIRISQRKLVAMEWLNYHHLLYFWKVAKLGSIARASEELRLAPPTISTQIRCLEESLEEKLFRRVGRNLVLTEVGQRVYDYAEEIFALGSELLNVVRQRPTGQPLKLNVGISDVVAKMVVREVLRPAFQLEQGVHVVCREGDLERLLADLATYRLDVVLSDRPPPETAKVKSFAHYLGGCGLTFFAGPTLSRRLGEGFPGSLDGSEALLPTHNTALRGNLERWFHALQIRPRVVAEFEDTALLMAFAADDLGFFAVPSVIEEAVQRRYGVEPIGRTEDCREEFYAISVERKLKHPAVLAVTESARSSLFS